MTTLNQSFSAVAAAAALSLAVVTPQVAVAGVDVDQLRIDMADVESRAVATPFFASVLDDGDTSSLIGGIYEVEGLLDFPATGFVSPNSSAASAQVADITRRALTNRATLVERACMIVDDASGSGRPNLAQVASRLSAIQSAMRHVAETVTLTSRPNLDIAVQAVEESNEIMEYMGAESSAIDALASGSVRVSALHYAVEDMYNRAAYVCANYPM